MKYFILIAAFLLLAFAPAPTGRALSGLDVFNTAAFDCESEKVVHQIEWTNDLGDVRIFNAKTWYGATGGTVADIGVIIYRDSDRTIFFHENWDHYAEPTGLHVSQLNLTPNYITLAEGDKINMAYWCQSFNPKQNQAHIIFTVWYAQ